MKLRTATNIVTVLGIACVASTLALLFNRPTKTVVREKPVETVKTVYVLSPDGKATDGTVAADEVKGDITTGFKTISGWTYPQDEHHYGDGFYVVEVDGQRCILWVRKAPGFNGEETGTGMSCRPIALK